MLHPPCRIRRTVGIDLGTTNSVIAMLDDTGSILLTGTAADGRMTFPSVVGHDPGKAQLVAGPDARSLISLAGHSAVTLPLSSVKRHMGLDRRFSLGPHSLSAPEVSALILKGLRNRMAHTLGDPRRQLDQAIITMPAYFNHQQIEHTRLAGELAGYEVVELLHEPTAAAIYYSWLHNHGDATYLVYDLGGGTFDVSIIRRRLDDHEVLSVSGDPFLGGDDFDRLLASHLLDVGSWTWSDGSTDEGDRRPLFDPTRPEGVPGFARLQRIAEQIKVELTSAERVDRYVPRLLVLPDGRELSLEVSVTRASFERLIRDKVARTLDCCHEALALARQRAGLRLGDIDHVVLVGGSSRVPLVRQLVQSAFANPDLPEHVRCCQMLLHEPDLCVAYGAALRAASHGTRYVFPFAEHELELHITSPSCTRDTAYQATGVVRVHGGDPSTILDGGSIRLRSCASGLIDEAFLDPQGGFVQDVELLPNTNNVLEWTICDAAGRDRASVATTIRHQPDGRPLGQGVLPTQLITKPLSIEVLSRGRQRIKQVLAPVGAPLPGTFRCTCRTSDQSGRIVVPICEENRVIKQLVIEDIDLSLPVGSPVEVEFAIDVRHHITVSVRVPIAGEPGPVRAGRGEPGPVRAGSSGEPGPVRAGSSGEPGPVRAGRERCETAHIEPPPSPRRPTRSDIQEVDQDLEQTLEQLSGRLRSRFRTRAQELQRDLLEALSYDDEPRAIQRMAELRDLLARAEMARSQALDPPWPRFTQLVRQCLDLAHEVARQTNRDPDELFQHVHTQERYAEAAYEDCNQALYRECWDNLGKYAGYLQQLQRDSIPRSIPRPTRSPEVEAQFEIQQFREQLSAVWKQVRSLNESWTRVQLSRADLEARLADIARQASNFNQRLKQEPLAVLRDARRLGVEIDKVLQQIQEPAQKAGSDHQGLLEGSS